MNKNQIVHVPTKEEGFKVGDKVKIKYCCSGTKPGEICELKFGSKDELEKDKLFAWNETVGKGACFCQDNWELVEKNKQIKAEKPLTNKTMKSDIQTFAKNLLLSKEEKLLRKYGLKNECGEFTTDAKDLVLEKLTKENEAFLVDIAKQKEAEEK